MSPLIALRRVLTPLSVITTLLISLAFASPSHAAPIALDDTVQMRTLAITRDRTALGLEYCGNGSVTESVAAVTDVIIVVHGDARGACSYATSVKRAADQAVRQATTLIVAPHFPIASDPEVQSTSPGNPAVLYWSGSGWKEGAQSRVSPLYRPWNITSFEAVDQLVDRVSDRRTFPSLKSITIAGHSAGGQFVNRYLATTKRPTEATSTVLRRWVVANPSSYLYLDGRRVNPAGQWETPPAERRTQCPDYNTYKYGLEGRTGYPAAMTDDQIRARVAQTPVTYLIGAEDTETDDPSLDTSCAGGWQGPDRYSRAINYQRHLRAVLPVTAAPQALVVVDGVGHSARAMFTSPEGVRTLFPGTTVTD